MSSCLAASPGPAQSLSCQDPQAYHVLLQQSAQTSHLMVWVRVTPTAEAQMPPAPIARATTHPATSQPSTSQPATSQPATTSRAATNPSIPQTGANQGPAIEAVALSDLGIATAPKAKDSLKKAPKPPASQAQRGRVDPRYATGLPPSERVAERGAGRGPFCNTTQLCDRIHFNFYISERLAFRGTSAAAGGGSASGGAGGGSSSGSNHYGGGGSSGGSSGSGSSGSGSYSRGHSGSGSGSGSGNSSGNSSGGNSGQGSSGPLNQSRTVAADSPPATNSGAPTEKEAAAPSEPVAVPTPALWPGLLALGRLLWRKPKDSP